MDPDPATIAESSARPHGTPPASDIADAPLHKQDLWREWDTFVEPRSDTGFMQSSWWVDFRSTCGFENFGIGLCNEGEIIGGSVGQGLLNQTRWWVYYIQDGPVHRSVALLAEPGCGAVPSSLVCRRTCGTG